MSSGCRAPFAASGKKFNTPPCSYAANGPHSRVGTADPATVLDFGCVCGLPWHGCGLHAHRGFTCRTRPRRACLNSGASKRDLPEPSNLFPIPSLLAPLSGLAKRPHPTCHSRSQARAVCARAAPPRARKRKFCSTRPHASDLEAVARIRDARVNPVPAESSHISTHCREKGQGDATPPLALIFFEIVADSEFRPLLFFSN